MIAFVEGRVAMLAHDSAVIEAGGVGYRVFCGPGTLTSLREGESARLFTHHLVREDQQALYGFRTGEELGFFELLTTVTGVGPKVALAVCSVLAPEQFRSAVATDDVAAIAAVPGIGKKTAQRIVIDLKEKLALPDLQIVGNGHDTVGQARSALENLGYSPAEVRQALTEVAPGANGNVEEVVRNALKVLS